MSPIELFWTAKKPPKTNKFWRIMKNFHQQREWISAKKYFEIPYVTNQRLLELNMKRSYFWSNFLQLWFDCKAKCMARNMETFLLFHHHHHASHCQHHHNHHHHYVNDFYRIQVYLGSHLGSGSLSVCLSVMFGWLDWYVSGWWRYQLNSSSWFQ